jgi:hypothetical protein
MLKKKYFSMKIPKSLFFKIWRGDYGGNYSRVFYPQKDYKNIETK